MYFACTLKGCAVNLCGEVDMVFIVRRSYFKHFACSHKLALNNAKQMLYSIYYSKNRTFSHSRIEKYRKQHRSKPFIVSV